MVTSPLPNNANTLIPRHTFCFQVGRQTIKYIVVFVCFRHLFVADYVVLNFTTIYKSDKCHSMAFIGEICWFISLGWENVAFSLLTWKLSHLRWHVINTLMHTTVCERNLFYFSFCIWSRQSFTITILCARIMRFSLDISFSGH